MARPAWCVIVCRMDDQHLRLWIGDLKARGLEGAARTALNALGALGPLAAQAIKEGRRVETPRFGVDEAICTGDHACIRLSGCPSLSLKKLDDPLRDDPVASIDQSCVGCGNCGEVADAAILCPSFYEARVVHNPTKWEVRIAAFRARLIGWLQARRSARRLSFEA